MVELNGGSNGTNSNVTSDTFIGTDNGPGKRTGIHAFLDNDVVSIMAVPGITDPNVQLTLVAHCENLANRFAVLDMSENLSKTDEILTHRNVIDSTYAAMYHPWLTVFDPLEVVNLIRSFPGQGIRVWGARTASSDPNWKYVNVRRLFIFFEESIKANTNWGVSEPNDERLWARVKSTIDGFLRSIWREGALAGSTEGEAFYCNIGPSTMSQDDINNGRLICEIGVAPVKPAEFVVFRITQKK